MNRYFGILLCATVLIAGFVTGCGGEPEPLSQKDKEQIEARKAKQKAYAAKQAKKEEESKKVRENHVPQVVNTEEAHAGVGVKGHYGNEPMMQPVTQAMSIYWDAQEKKIFEFQIGPGLEKYKAEHGYYPGEKAMKKAKRQRKSKAEIAKIDAECQAAFEREILKPLRLNMKKLPELPSGKRYYYDAEKGKLMVETLR